MLTLPIKRKWLDMILAGEKLEEYREIKPYYISRFKNHINRTHHHNPGELIFETVGQFFYALKVRNIHYAYKDIILRAGYRKDSRAIRISGVLSIDTGNPQWGAEPGKKYFVLYIGSAEEMKEND